MPSRFAWSRAARTNRPPHPRAPHNETSTSLGQTTMSCGDGVSRRGGASWRLARRLGQRTPAAHRRTCRASSSRVSRAATWSACPPGRRRRPSDDRALLVADASVDEVRGLHQIQRRFYIISAMEDALHAPITPIRPEQGRGVPRIEDETLRCRRTRGTARSPGAPSRPSSRAR